MVAKAFVTGNYTPSFVVVIDDDCTYPNHHQDLLHYIDPYLLHQNHIHHLLLRRITPQIGAYLRSYLDVDGHVPILAYVEGWLHCY